MICRDTTDNLHRRKCYVAGNVCCSTRNKINRNKNHPQRSKLLVAIQDLEVDRESTSSDATSVWMIEVVSFTSVMIHIGPVIYDLTRDQLQEFLKCFLHEKMCSTTY